MILNNLAGIFGGSYRTNSKKKQKKSTAETPFGLFPIDRDLEFIIDLWVHFNQNAKNLLIVRFHGLVVLATFQSGWVWLRVWAKLEMWSVDTISAGWVTIHRRMSEDHKRRYL